MHGVGRRLLFVIGDNRRAIVEVAIVEARAGELLHVYRYASSPTRWRAASPSGESLLQMPRYVGALANGAFGMFHGEARDLLGDRLAFHLMGIKNRLGRPALKMRRQHPRQIHRVRDACVHAIARIWHPNVCGVSTDECAAVLEAIGYQPPSEPVLLSEQLVLEIRPDAEQCTDAGVPVDRFEVRFAAAGDSCE